VSIYGKEPISKTREIVRELGDLVFKLANGGEDKDTLVIEALLVVFDILLSLGQL
jgi:hypothetical protein